MEVICDLSDATDFAKLCLLPTSLNPDGLMQNRIPSHRVMNSEPEARSRCFLYASEILGGFGPWQNIVYPD